MTCLLGLRRPSSGDVTLGGQPVGSGGPVGYVPQHDVLHGNLTVRQALGYAARLRLWDAPPAARQARVDQVCAQVQLGDRLDVRIARLSGGQKKRVSVAMELLTGPPLLVLDEPTSGLDPRLEGQSMRLFAELAAADRVVLVSTHAMASLDACTVLLVLVAGRVAWFGPPKAALEWFEVLDYSGIFDKLARRAPPVWARSFASSEAARAMARRTGPLTAPAAAPAVAAPAPAPSAAERLAALKAQLRDDQP